MSAASRLTNGDENVPATDAGESESLSSHVRSLIDPEYDTKTIKHAWLNGVINATPLQDINESLLRLYRVELRGSHLYVYRPPLLMNVRLFKLDLQPNSSDPGAALEAEQSALTGSETGTKSLARTDLRSMGGTTIATSSSHFASNGDISSLSNGFGAPSTLDKAATASSLSVDDKTVAPSSHITYFLHILPHPELKFDATSGAFLPSSSNEALVHFFMFADSQLQAKTIRHLAIVFPLLPKFGDILLLMYEFLLAIYEGKFLGYEPNATLCERVISFLLHLNENFGGFLLQADIAPYIPKLLQCLTSANEVSLLDSITQLQNSIVSTQERLLGLLGKLDAAGDPVSPENVFTELSSHEFVHNTNLLDLVQAITEIDLLFFRAWNSSLDKSLLLFTSVCENNPGDYFYKKNPLIFNNETHIHYLSRLLVHHLFIENPRTSPEKLARILEKWIDLGCLLDKTGNMSSWLGISSIVLSQPILRLSSVWAHVGEEYIKLLKNDWSPILFELDRRHLATTNEPLTVEGASPSSSKESYHIMAPRGLGKIYPKEKVIPYFGDLLVNNLIPADAANLEAVWRKITYSFDRWNEYLGNLSDSHEIISYNQDVLRRYDSMSFIFSNENLNQVLYLGVNKDDGKALGPFSKQHNVGGNGMFEEAANAQIALRDKLLRLLNMNRESINLDFVMGHSLRLEPDLKEGYLETPTTNNFDVSLKSSSGATASSLSLASTNTEGGANDAIIKHQAVSKDGPSADDKLPTFNLAYYKIDMAKYDDLALSPGQKDAVPRDVHNIVVDNDLVLRLDDFTSEFESNVTPSVSAGAASQLGDDEDGLGIDVEHIMNSDKFKNFSILGDNDDTEELSLSKRKHGSFGLVSDHATSVARSQPETYIPRLATMEKLIDLLLIDSKYFDDNHPIDLTEYRYVFMLNYGSFITTRNLLESLAHKFVHSGNAVISVMKKQYLQKRGTYDPLLFGLFPRWLVDADVNLSDLGEVDYKLLLQIQINILKVLILLLNSFFQNYLNDLNNKNIMIKLLKLYSNEILQWYNSNKIDKNLNDYFETLVDFYKRLKNLFIKKTYRPLEVLSFDTFLSRELQFSRTVKEVPMNRNLPSHRNIHKVEKFLNKFNKLLAILYQGITLEDWFTTFKVLETLFTKNTLLNYKSQNVSTEAGELQISDVFTYLESLYGSDLKDRVLTKLPLVFKKLYTLYLKFKAYLSIQLSDESITVDERLERMRTFLLMIQISRLKMKDSQFIFEGDRDEIPSCIETAITSVVYSPQSRSLAHLWHKASAKVSDNRHSRGQSFDDIEFLLPKQVKQSDLLAGHEPLLPCFGWIIQNLIDLNRCPSFHRSAINFNKRYFLFKLIKELQVEEIKSETLHKDTKEFEFLLNLDEAVAHKGYTSFELATRGTDGVFQAVIQRQYAILASDETKRSMGDKSSLDFDLIHASNSSGANLKRLSLAYKTPSSSRFKISGLFNKSRSFGHPSQYDRCVSYKELPDPESAVDPRQKPVLILLLKDKKIFPVYLLPFSFKFDTSNANEACFFQAFSEPDAKEWLRRLNYANRHWYLSRTINLRDGHVYTTFGVPLATICARDKSDAPAVLQIMYNAIEADGLKEVGLYRISTSLSELSGTKAEINRTGTINLEKRCVDVHTLTSCVKLFFRELPDALLTDRVIEMILPSKRPAGENHGFTTSDVEAFRNALATLPTVNYHTLKALVRHLSNIVKEYEVNKMTSSNLATVIGPALTEASSLDSLINNFGLMNHVLEKLIENYASIFEQHSAIVGEVGN